MQANTKQVRAIMRKAIVLHNANGRVLYCDEDSKAMQSWTDKAKFDGADKGTKRYVTFAVAESEAFAVLVTVRIEFEKLGYENYTSVTTGEAGGTYLRCTAYMA